MKVTVTETVDTETLIRVEALTVMVIGLHVLLEDGGKVLDVVNTGPVNAQEQALEILLGTLEHYETKDGRPACRFCIQRSSICSAKW
jgi:hypothetical protein